MRSPNRRLATALLALLSTALLAAPPPDPTPPDAAERWDLSPLYASDEAWREDYDGLRAATARLAERPPAVGDGGDGLLAALDSAFDLRARAARLAIYGFLRSIEERSAEAQRLYDAGTGIESEVEAAIEPIEAGVRALGSARLSALAHDPRFERHRRRLNRILHDAPYVLGAEGQAVVESMARWPRLAGDTYDALHAVDLGWPRRADGSVVDRAAHMRLRASAAPADREDARRFLARLAELGEPFALLYTRRVEADRTIARSRGFASGIDAIWLLRDGMPIGSARRPFELAERERAILRRYALARARALALAPSYDNHLVAPPLPRSDWSFAPTLERAIGALRPLGPEFEARLRDRLGRRWTDLLPRTDKQRTYAIFPAVPGAVPFAVMSYEPSLVAARQLAGALALLMTFADVPPDRISETRDDPGIFSNGILYAGALLFDDEVRAAAATPADRARSLVHGADFLWSQFFRWALVTEFDRRTEEAVGAGRPPSAAELSATYLGLLRRLLGHGEGGLTVDDHHGAEWMLWPVPFVSYEHQFWPPAIAAGCALVEPARAGDVRPLRCAFEVLGRTDLDLTHSLFDAAGLDMTSSAPYDALLRRLERLVGELESLPPGAAAP